MMQRRNRYGESGAAVMETAIILPVLLLLVLGSFELGRGVWTKHVLSHVAREAARYASVRSASSDDPATSAGILARAKEAAAGIDTTALTVLTSWNPANAPGATVNVHVLYSFRPVTPLVPFETIELSSTSQRLIVY